MWWERPGLEAREGRLLVAGRDAEGLARTHGTPLYAFDLASIGERIRALQDAFAGAGQPFRYRYALKANREPGVLAFIRGLVDVGMDVCSPGEVLHAIEHGWSAGEISYTGTNVSDRDLDVILEHEVHMNLDLLSQLRRYGRRAPGTAVGLRVNPRAGAKWDEASKSVYALADRPTKFGIYREDLPEALDIATEYDLRIDTVHLHVGDGFLTPGLPAFEPAVEAAAEMTAWLTEQGCPIAEVNAGGGLGVPQREGDEPLDLAAYAALLTRHLGPLGVTIACEPGDYTAKQSGVLLAEVVTVEDRLGTRFVGTDVGFAAGPEHFIYASPQPIVLCRDADGPPASLVTVSGHINEGPDLWGEDIPLPDVEEGDIIAILNIGTYNQSMSMRHCLRPAAAAVYFADRAY
jgi:diaminopimelate decarboxylase